MSTIRSDGEATRKKLLAAAGVIFAAKGFHDATTAEICRMAGANIAAVNYHFRSKKNLYTEAWRHAFELSMAAHPPDGGVPAGASAEKRLHGQILALIRRLADPDSIDFDIVHKEIANPTGLLTEVMRRSISPTHQRFKDTVRELLGKDASDESARLCEMSIHAQCMEYLRHTRLRKSSCIRCKPRHLVIDAESLAEHIFRFSLAGIRETGKEAGRIHEPAKTRKARQ